MQGARSMTIYCVSLTELLCRCMMLIKCSVTFRVGQSRTGIHAYITDVLGCTGMLKSLVPDVCHHHSTKRWHISLSLHRLFRVWNPSVVGTLVLHFYVLEGNDRGSTMFCPCRDQSIQHKRLAQNSYQSSFVRATIVAQRNLGAQSRNY
jgi:hypothetical protein